jgi:hypothetical protein
MRGSSPVRSTSWNTLKASTPTKVRWIGEALPGREVYSSFQRPSSCGSVVGPAGVGEGGRGQWLQEVLLMV